MPARRGLPMNIGGLVDVVNSPMYATGAGLVLWRAAMGAGKVKRISDGNLFAKVIGRMREWVENFF